MRPWPKSGSVYSDYATCWTVQGSNLGRVKRLSSKKCKPVVWPTEQFGVTWLGQATAHRRLLSRLRMDVSLFVLHCVPSFLQHRLYLFLSTVSMLCATQGVAYPAISDWCRSIFRARISPTVPRWVCVMIE